MTPIERLHDLLVRAEESLSERSVVHPENLERLGFVCRYTRNRACVRLLMACLLAKLNQPEIDPRKPYTEIGSDDSFSGRTYDEKFITRFIQANRLPCNSTTAFLTPTLRNIDRPLTTDIKLVGRPRQLYVDTLRLLEEVALNRESAENMLLDTIRILVQMRDERLQRLQSLQANLRGEGGSLSLASEAIAKLIEQHLACRNSSRLPVLIVAAAYRAASDRLGELYKPLQAHNAADEQTGAAGDVEITLINEDQVRTIYEMKRKRVTSDDLDRALQKIATLPHRLDNYIFITTDPLDPTVAEYAATLYESTGGTEVAILDCIGFLRHYLHLFHRKRTDFLNVYQELVLTEPDSSVSLSLKEAFLALRQAAESDE